MEMSGWCCRTEPATRANRSIVLGTGLYFELSAYERSGASRALIPPEMASTQTWRYPRGPISCSTDGPRKGSIGYLGTLIGLSLSVLKRMTKNPTGFLVLSQVSKLRPVPPSLCAGMDVGYPPAHRDETAMNGAQLLKARRDSSDRATCPWFHLDFASGRIICRALELRSCLLPRRWRGSGGKGCSHDACLRSSGFIGETGRGIGAGIWHLHGCLGHVGAGAEDRRGGDGGGVLPAQAGRRGQGARFPPRPHSRQPSHPGRRTAERLKILSWSCWEKGDGRSRFVASHISRSRCGPPAHPFAKCARGWAPIVVGGL